MKIITTIFLLILPVVVFAQTYEKVNDTTGRIVKEKAPEVVVVSLESIQEKLDRAMLKKRNLIAEIEVVDKELTLLNADYKGLRDQGVKLQFEISQ